MAFLPSLTQKTEEMLTLQLRTSQKLFLSKLINLYSTKVFCEENKNF